MDGAIAWMPLLPELPVVGTVTQTLARGTPAHCMQDKSSLAAAEVSLLDLVLFLPAGSLNGHGGRNLEL
jgi:hypothetical protein